MNLKLFLAIVFIGGIICICSVMAGDSKFKRTRGDYSASVVIEIVDEVGVPVPNAYVVNLSTNEPFRVFDIPKGLVDSNGTIRLNRLISSLFLVVHGSDSTVVTNIPLAGNFQTNRIILKQTPNNPAHPSSQGSQGGR